MPRQGVNGARLMCSFGVAASSLMVPPTDQVLCGNHSAANTMDHIPMITSFGMCMSIANPQVAAATAAALGVLTPQPCIPPPLRLGCRVRSLPRSAISPPSTTSRCACATGSA